MIELITIALFQFFALNSQADATAPVGGTGWGNNDVNATQSAQTVGGTGWGNNDVNATQSAQTVGGTGWGNNDITK